MLYSIRLFLTEFVIPYHPIIGLPIRENFIKEKRKRKMAASAQLPFKSLGIPHVT
jgi:hypothetical protein